jgi:DNA mismatch endonuclease, patch repair protein
MSKISGKESKPEILVRKFLFANGFRYRKNVKKLPGKPDIVFSKYKTVIFVHGCFWHGHECKAAKLPDNNHVFWEEKIKANIERDKKNIQYLQDMGWRTIILWQCEIKSQSLVKSRLELLSTQIKIKVVGQTGLP